MNFYGHSIFAAGLSPDPAYALGSMLPDFEGMCGARLVESRSATVRDGIALHHATDTVFHGAPEFLALCSEGHAALTAAGMARATARACAHVGTELVFDSFLIETYGEQPIYLDALDAGSHAGVGGDLVFADGGVRFEGLRTRLSGFGVPRSYAEAGFVADRLVNALASRPRLAMAEGDHARVVAWLQEGDARIRASAPSIVDRVSEALGSRMPPVRGG